MARGTSHEITSILFALPPNLKERRSRTFDPCRYPPTDGWNPYR